MLKIAVFAPMPSARETMATAVTTGAFTNTRRRTEGLAQPETSFTKGSRKNNFTVAG
jgi:hypothetical protein